MPRRITRVYKISPDRMSSAQPRVGFACYSRIIICTHASRKSRAHAINPEHPPNGEEKRERERKIRKIQARKFVPRKYCFTSIGGMTNAHTSTEINNFITYSMSIHADDKSFSTKLQMNL